MDKEFFSEFKKNFANIIQDAWRQRLGRDDYDIRHSNAVSETVPLTSSLGETGEIVHVSAVFLVQNKATGRPMNYFGSLWSSDAVDVVHEIEEECLKFPESDFSEALIVRLGLMGLSAVPPWALVQMMIDTKRTEPERFAGYLKKVNEVVP